MKVKALTLGFYGNKRVRKGEIFILGDKKHFSNKWMVRLSDVKEEVKTKKKVKATKPVEDSKDTIVI